ncbi:hypothetical protein PILCRDRAFT_815700 [Piloderma croceum F 1598]|uniref:Uncharacterized protein n=1 Tax=Piloderma croceum (strain F 1598) TaxID=765440 RepID=A0A0C3CC25_PILCF|nr:hypothetical protein PILCRDRAFT_815700 [Piloderma croceum F 1598]
MDSNSTPQPRYTNTATVEYVQSMHHFHPASLHLDNVGVDCELWKAQITRVLARPDIASVSSSDPA